MSEPGPSHDLPTLPLDVVAQQVRAQVGPDAPGPARMMAARALLPLPPDQLIPALAYLASAAEPAIARVAAETLEQLPEAVLRPVLGSPRADARVLDFLARRFVRVRRIVEPIITNNATSDETVAWVAAATKDTHLLEIIALNQVRALRHPDIIEALYFNAATPTAAVTQLVEVAVRSGVDLSHIPGWREIVESVVGPVRRGGEPQRAPEVGSEDVPLQLDDGEGDELAAFLQAGSEEDVPVVELDENLGGDDELMAILQGGAWGALWDEDEEVEEKRNEALWLRVRKMSIPQRVRLALMGDETVRRLLIRDPRKIVARSVLENPKLTDKEIMTFASTKSLDDEIVRRIARNREWTRLYGVRLALVRNPKTPASIAMSFLSTLNERDLKTLARDKEVPGYIQKTAKEIVARRRLRRQ